MTRKNKAIEARGDHRAREVATDFFGASLNKPAGTVIDLFCGAGALSHGFGLEGFSVACGYDIDEECCFPFEGNNLAPFVRRDVAKLNHAEIRREFAPGLPRILAGCAPCQPFSRYSQGHEDPKWQLLGNFADLAAALEPDIVTMENVPQLLQFKGGSVFNAFTKRLKNRGYTVRHMVADCPEFGVPQNRSRLVVIASLHGEPLMPISTHIPANYVTVSQAIGDLPHLEAGMVDARDRLHRASEMSPLNLERIRASHAGGTWRDWEPRLLAKCHKRPTGRGYTGVYGRIRWDRPSPTITTQFYGFGNGRFGHPEQDRALSLREGAILQSFPHKYTFLDSHDLVRFKSVGRMIGNAVPILLARAIARAIKTHLQEHRS